MDFLDNRSERPLDVKIGISHVSIENARQNLESEIADKDFTDVRNEADAVWENLLGKIAVEGADKRKQSLFIPPSTAPHSCLGCSAM